MGWRWGLNTYGHGRDGGGDGRVVVGTDGGGGVVMVMECLRTCMWVATGGVGVEWR